jgi:hypothetical protein
MSAHTTAVSRQPSSSNLFCACMVLLVVWVVIHIHARSFHEGAYDHYPSVATCICGRVAHAQQPATLPPAWTTVLLTVHITQNCVDWVWSAFTFDVAFSLGKSTLFVS